MTRAGGKPRPIEVAIIGGGCASMAAAFELTKPHHAGRYHVTVYQEGWRLGGKGASGRGPADRIEEHGLHLWMGFYENAFRLMRECYAELGRDPSRCRIATWTDAFKPNHFNAVADLTPSGEWKPWMAYFPPLSGQPGDPESPEVRWTISDYLVRTAMLSRYFLDGIRERTGERLETRAGGEGGGAGGDAATPPLPPAAALMESVARLVRYGQIATLTAANEAVRFLEAALRLLPAVQEDLLIRFADAIAQSVRQQIEALIGRDDAVRRLWEMWDLTLAVIRGTLRHRLITDPRGFDAINDYDCREWLQLNGASARAINCAFVRGLYDLAFAYENGDVTRPRIAAGDALRGTLRAFFTYRGAFFWKMQSGMGDVVFAPLYEVLRRRGATFRFFHRLRDVEIAQGGGEDRPHVSALTFDVQAKVRGAREYEPLVDVRGLPCWPAEPSWAQLEDGARLKAGGVAFESHWERRRAGTRKLEVGQDFDLVVLGVGLGAIPYVCRGLIERDPRWRTMVEKVKTVPTQALQVWLREDMKALGWPHPPVNISGFVEPFDTWADMSHLISEETFRQPVGAIAYFCSVLPDRAGPGDDDADQIEGRLAEVRNNAERFLARDVRHLWPAAVNARGEFRWDLLVDAAGGAAGGATGGAKKTRGAGRLAGQYVRANVNPSERYVLSLPGTSRYRISPLDDSYDNLTVAGDWTDCGLNEGCVEAAVMSGRLAAHALSQSPPLNEIVGFDHP